MSEKNAPNLTPHTLTRYDEDLNALRSLLMNMGGVAEQHFGDALAYLLDGDAERGRVAMEKDYEIDQLEVSIDELSIHLIARYAPTAGDLRTIMAIVKAITDLERVGDKSEKLARIAEEVGPALQTTEFATHFPGDGPYRQGHAARCARRLRSPGLHRRRGDHSSRRPRQPRVQRGPRGPAQVHEGTPRYARPEPAHASLHADDRAYR
ncbi:MAG TPA: hypothetical protein ENO19_06465, partial [Halothiobacillaceae bacterium]|nr:hypothetical protein [Halothiobacillaceae bacterium]